MINCPHSETGAGRCRLGAAGEPGAGGRACGASGGVQSGAASGGAAAAGTPTRPLGPPEGPCDGGGVRGAGPRRRRCKAGPVVCNCNGWMPGTGSV